MTKFTKKDELITGSNRVPAKQSHIFIITYEAWNDAQALASWERGKEIHWTKYQIKETDMRIKTATFSSPQYIDLSKGKHMIKITSPYHENFAGLVLSAEYDEKNSIYNYQCQDWSRIYQSKTNLLIFDVEVYNILRSLMTLGGVGFTPTDKELKAASGLFAGLRPKDHYKQEYWSSTIKFNPMTDKPNLKIKDKTHMDMIRELVYGSGAYVDIYFNDNGIMQIEPYDKNDFFNTGLHLLKPEAVDNKFKFDTTNIFTQVLVSNSEAKTDIQQIVGKVYTNEILYAFFGIYSANVSDKDTWVALGNKAEATDTKSTSSSSSGSGTATNPFKGKKLWLVSDGGSDDFKNELANKLKNKGYTVHVGGTGPQYHYNDYFNVKKDYVYLVLQNGFCACSVREAYSDKIQNTLKSKNVQLVMLFDTRTWTNPNGMKPYRYGDFSGYKAKRAWDDNFCSFDPTINDVGKYFKEKNAIYCAYPSTDGIIEQFEAGGYFKWKANK